MTTPVTANGRRRITPWNAPGRVVFALAHIVADRGLHLMWRWRRWRLVTGIQLRAWWHRSTLTLDVAHDLQVGRRIRVSVEPRTTGSIKVGPGGRWGDGVRIELAGGEIMFGPGVDIRTLCVMHVTGRLEIGGANVLQNGCTLHCDERITIQERSSLGEYVTVVDSTHRHGGSSGWFGHDVETSPVNLGPDVWVATKATITRGVDIGESATVGANSVVIRDVEPNTLVSGVPAQVIPRRKVEHSGDAEPRPARAPQAVPASSGNDT